MSEQSGLIAAVTIVGKLVIVLGIPLGVARLAARVFDRTNPPDFPEVPLAGAMPRLLGLTLGLVLVYDRYGWHNFDLHSLFDIGGPWDLSLGQFLLQRANPFHYGVASLIDYFARSGVNSVSILVAFLLVALMLGTIMAPLAYWDTPVARRVAFGNLACAVVTTYLTIYVVVLLFWLLYLLNFWTFALLAAIFQYYRSRA
jgi:hypothetical protein